MGKIVHTERIITISIFVNSYSDLQPYLVVNMCQQIHVMTLSETKIYPSPICDVVTAGFFSLQEENCGYKLISRIFNPYPSNVVNIVSS
jgi:hypothetical protein